MSIPMRDPVGPDDGQRIVERNLASAVRDCIEQVDLATRRRLLLEVLAEVDAAIKAGASSP